MILLRDPGPAPLLASGVYHVRAEGGTAFAAEAQALWAFLHAAAHRPVGLILLPPGAAGGVPASASCAPRRTDCQSVPPPPASGASSLSPWERAGVRAVPENDEPHTLPLPPGEGRGEGSAQDTSSLPPTAPGRLAELLSLSPAEPCEASFVSLSTSGTTGRPKPMTHRLDAALAPRGNPDPDARWLLTYAPFRWAGLSVLMHVFRTRSAAVLARSLDAADLVAAAEAFSATHVSLTPSMFRRLLVSVPEARLRACGIRQVTFGGEAASQAVLDDAADLWPAARISHVYASTEAGDVCCVSDGRAGIPAAKLCGPRFAFSDRGELAIDGRPTGDLWELRDGRYHFLGRTEEMINVGGAKVSPLWVEEAALAVAGVDQARAYAVPSPLLGQLVALDYRGSAPESAVRLAFQALPKVARPAQIRRVPEITLTDAGKTCRITHPPP